MTGLLDSLCEPVRSLRQAGILDELDVHVVECTLRAGGVAAADPAAQLALALASRAVAEAHACLELGAVTPEWIAGLHPDRDLQAVSLPGGVEGLCIRLADPAGRRAAFKSCRGGVGGAEDGLPFVLDGDRLYLRRYWDYERSVARGLLALARAAEGEAIEPETEVRIGRILDREPQRRAARRALTRRLTVISGGPGTGKTYTAARILALLSQRPGPKGRPWRIRMAAPTGKAAARMDESVRSALAELAGQGFRVDAALAPACTLERLLGYRSGSPYFRHDAANPLDADGVLIDEASMVDLPKMAKLLDALAPATQLVLLGDMHQLASVEVGCVLAAICRCEPLRDAVVELTESIRFDARTPLGRLSLAVNAADSGERAAEAWQLIGSGEDDNAEGPTRGASLVQRDAPDSLEPRFGEVDSSFARSVLAGYREFLAADEPAAAFRALGRFRVLCALRRGPLGAERVNGLVENILALRGIRAADIPAGLAPERKLKPEGDFYSHRVIMVTKNDPALALFNGDVGIVLPDPAANGERRVFFERPGPGGAGAALRSVSLRILPPHMTAFALTIHKAQGSECDRVLVLVPRRDNPLLTRELLYTAITRAARGVELWCAESIFRAMVQRPIRRFSGLVRQLEVEAGGSRTGSVGDGSKSRLRRGGVWR